VTLLVAGCQQNQGDGGSSPPSTSVVSQVIAQTKSVCKFVPDVDPIVKLIPTIGGAVSDIADAICSAVKSSNTPAAPGASVTVVVSGVQVSGVFAK